MNFKFYWILLLLIIYLNFTSFYLQPQIRKSWDSMENANKKRK